MIVTVMSRDRAGHPQQVCTLALSPSGGAIVSSGGDAAWLLEMPMYVDGGRRQVASDENPGEWLAAVPSNFAGAYVWAEASS